MAYVGVAGPSDADEHELRVAGAVGRGLAQRGHVVVCGGLGGVMEAVSRVLPTPAGWSSGCSPAPTGPTPTRTSRSPYRPAWASSATACWSGRATSS